jgi:hypothetical protein
VGAAKKSNKLSRVLAVQECDARDVIRITKAGSKNKISLSEDFIATNQK